MVEEEEIVFFSFFCFPRGEIESSPQGLFSEKPEPKLTSKQAGGRQNCQEHPERTQESG
jgi:hypothetical protein